MFDPVPELPARARVAFAACFVGVQAALVLTADRRPDAAFGFRMFSESSELEPRLLREVDGPDGPVEVHAPGGEWVAKDAIGVPHRLKWSDRVHRKELSAFDAVIHASYGAKAQIARFQAAVDDVAAHTPDDAETRRLVVELTVRRNGRPGEKVRLVSAPRRR